MDISTDQITMSGPRGVLHVQRKGNGLVGLSWESVREGRSSDANLASEAAVRAFLTSVYRAENGGRSPCSGDVEPIVRQILPLID